MLLKHLDWIGSDGQTELNNHDTWMWWSHEYGLKSNVYHLERAISNPFDFLIGIQEVASLWTTVLQTVM